MTLKRQVEQMLKEFKDTRNSDAYLTVKIWKTYYSEEMKDYDLNNPYDLFSFLKEVPSQENIKRWRAKFQNDRKLYLPTSRTVAIQRKWREEEWRSLMGYNPEMRTL